MFVEQPSRFVEELSMLAEQLSVKPKNYPAKAKHFYRVVSMHFGQEQAKDDVSIVCSYYYLNKFHLGGSLPSRWRTKKS